MPSDIPQCSYGLPLSYTVRKKNKYYTPPCDLVQVPRVALTTFAVPTLCFQLWLKFPTLDLKIHSLTSTKKAILYLLWDK